MPWRASFELNCLPIFQRPTCGPASVFWRGFRREQKRVIELIAVEWELRSFRCSRTAATRTEMRLPREGWRAPLRNQTNEDRTHQTSCYSVVGVFPLCCVGRFRFVSNVSLESQFG